MKKNITLFILLFCSLGIIRAQQQPTFTIATYNLRMNTERDGINAWPNRKEWVKELIRFHEFDIFGTQEGFKGQLNDLSEMKEFAYAGVGREDGQEGGEHSAIFYKPERFELIRKGDFWFSETSDTPSKGWDATCCNRICSWVELKERQTQKTFFVFNAHYDHEGRVARLQSSHLLLRKIKEIAGDAPVFVTGDLNANPDNEAIQVLSNVLRDSYNHSETTPYGPEGTFNAFKHDAELTSRIDYILTNDSIRILKYGVLSDSKNNRYPSDHLPVMVKAMLR